MKEHFVIDPLIGKRQQLLLATQLCRMVLKVWSHLVEHLIRKWQLTFDRSTKSSSPVATRMSFSRKHSFMSCASDKPHIGV